MTDEIAAREAFAFFIKAGLTGSQACGILASMEAESDFNPRAVGDHGQAHGICQWHNDRVQNMHHGCGIDVRSADLGGQLRACLWEMQHVETTTWENLKRARNAAQAAAVVVTDYERPANLHQQIAVRVADAEHFARLFGVA